MTHEEALELVGAIAVEIRGAVAPLGMGVAEQCAQAFMNAKRNLGLSEALLEHMQAMGPGDATVEDALADHARALASTAACLVVILSTLELPRDLAGDPRVRLASEQ